MGSAASILMKAENSSAINAEVKDRVIPLSTIADRMRVFKNINSGEVLVLIDHGIGVFNFEDTYDWVEVNISKKQVMYFENFDITKPASSHHPIFDGPRLYADDDRTFSNKYPSEGANESDIRQKFGDHFSGNYPPQILTQSDHSPNIEDESKTGMKTKFDMVNNKVMPIIKDLAAESDKYLKICLHQIQLDFDDSTPLNRSLLQMIINNSVLHHITRVKELSHAAPQSLDFVQLHADLNAIRAAFATKLENMRQPNGQYTAQSCRHKTKLACGERDGDEVVVKKIDIYFLCSIL